MPIPERATIKANLIALLQERGEISPDVAYDLLSDIWGLTSEERSLIRSGDLLYKHEIRWARQDLVIEGTIERPAVSGRANWKLKVNRNSEAYQSEIPTGMLVMEGSINSVLVNKFERNSAAREKCIKVHGYKCKACEFSFEHTYGIVGKGCIHVHHVVPISSIGAEYELDPISDLIPLCPNCHYMIHRREPPFSVDEIRVMLAQCKLHK